MTPRDPPPTVDEIRQAIWAAADDDDGPIF